MLAEAPGVFAGGNPWNSVSKDADLICNGNIFKVFTSFPRTVPVWVSVEQVEYLNYKDFYPANIPLNI